MLKAKRSGEALAEVEVVVETTKGAEESTAVAVVEDQEQGNAVTVAEEEKVGFSTLSVRSMIDPATLGGQDEVARELAEKFGMYGGGGGITYLKAEGKELVSNGGEEHEKLVGVVNQGLFFFEYYDKDLKRGVRVKSKPYTKVNGKRVLDIEKFRAQVRDYNPFVSEERLQTYDPADFRYRAELHFTVPEEADMESGEVTEPQRDYIVNLPSKSALNFRENYVKRLASMKKAPNQVLTELSVTKQRDKNNGTTYARIEFTALDIETGEPLGLTTVGVDNPDFGKRG